MTTRKPRGDSKLDALAPSQKEQLAEWLTVENLTYAEARTRVAEQFGVFTTASALQSFYSRFAAPWSYARAAGDAEAFASLMEGKFEPAAIKAAKQLAFTALTSPQPDLKTAKTLFKIVGDSAKLTLAQEKISLDARKVALLEKKAAQADAASAVTSDAKLSDEEKFARYRQIFGG
ncbi:MAG: hypothetical protein HZA93_23805 [Verrucomicrobia bacterium]|nr:hypothetical protein [Verrucomicrobiota bacterium]